MAGEGFDFADGRPGVAAILAAGRSFVCRYLGPDRFGAKGITLQEFNSYVSGGVGVVLNFESSGLDATSYGQGVQDAQYAQAQVAALGQPNAVIYFSIDEQAAPDPTDYFRGVEAVIGHDRAAVYGGYDTLVALHAAGLCSYFWMTFAWEAGRPVPAFVHIYQYKNNQTINGAQVDFDRSLQDYFGQIGTGLAGLGSQPFDPTDEEEMFTIYNNGGAGYMIVGNGSFMQLGTTLTTLTGVDGAATLASFEAAGAKTVVLSQHDWDVVRVNIIAGNPQPTIPAPTLSDAQLQTLEQGVVSAVTAAGVDLPQAQIDAIAAAVRAQFTANPLK